MNSLDMLLGCQADIEKLAEKIIYSQTFKKKAPGILAEPIAKLIPYALDECGDEAVLNKFAEILCKPLHCTCFASPPLANTDNVETTLDAGITFNVVANDLASSKFCPIDPTTVTIIQEPTNGEATNNLDGTITYVPTDGFVGNDTLRYRVSDECCQCAEGIVYIAVLDEDIGPSCTDAEDLEVTQNETLSILLTSYYTLGTGSVSLVTGFSIEEQAINGTLVLNGDGTATYTPNADFLGNDVMAVRVTDENGLYCIINIYIATIPPVLIPIDCNDDSYTIAFNTVSDFDVTVNDITDELCDIIGSVCLIETPTNGSATVIANGVVRYTPNTDWCGNDTFRYAVTDSCGRTCEADVAIEVLPPGCRVLSCQVINTQGCDFMAFTMEDPIVCASENIIVYVEDECGLIQGVPVEASLVSGCIVLIELAIWNALLMPNCEDEPIDCVEVKSIGCGAAPLGFVNSD